MAPAVSFVIPVLNEGDRVGALLEFLRARYAGAELIVVDGGSRDGTVAAALPRCDQTLLSPPGRARQMNLGARVADGTYLFFLHADTRPSLSADELAATLATGPEWGFSRVRLSGRQPALRLVEWGMNRRSAATRVATGDQMLYLHRDLFQRTGGFADIPLMEDVEYCKRLRRLAAPRVLPRPVVTSSRRWEQHGILRTVLAMWWLRLGYLLGASPARLHDHYYGR
jgi:rSAM/selenodomain-associated transferase 2